MYVVCMHVCVCVCVCVCARVVRLSLCVCVSVFFLCVCVSLSLSLSLCRVLQGPALQELQLRWVAGLVATSQSPPPLRSSSCNGRRCKGLGKLSVVLRCLCDPAGSH